jgi:ribosomal-protein-alanine N-acetyltransferase
VWTVRQATAADERRLRRLIAGAKRAVLRFREESLRDYLPREPFLLAEEAGKLRGFLAFLLRRPRRAALVAAGLADDWAVSLWLDRLLPCCVTHLQAHGALSLSYVGAATWLTEPLQERGFQLVSCIVTYEKTGWAIPAVGNQMVKVRSLQPADLPALVALDALAFHPLWRNSVGSLKQWQDSLPFFVVAMLGEQVVGYCYCSVERTHGHLIRVAVHPDWQGRGIGTRLMAEAMRFFRKTGAQLITLNTQKENERAQWLYSKFGFRLIGQEAVALWKDL